MHLFGWCVVYIQGLATLRVPQLVNEANARSVDAVRKTASLRPLFILKTVHCQDRLGTDMGQVDFKGCCYLQAEVDAALHDPESPKTALIGAENAHLLRHFILKRGSFYQDRLGTNIAKALKKTCVFRSADPLARKGAKTSFLVLFCSTKNRIFTKHLYI